MRFAVREEFGSSLFRLTIAAPEPDATTAFYLTKPSGVKPAETLAVSGTAKAVPLPILHDRNFMFVQPAGEDAGATNLSAC
jgi:hypothetical protein